MEISSIELLEGVSGTIGGKFEFEKSSIALTENNLRHTLNFSRIRELTLVELKPSIDSRSRAPSPSLSATRSSEPAIPIWINVSQRFAYVIQKISEGCFYTIL